MVYASVWCDTGINTYKFLSAFDSEEDFRNYRTYNDDIFLTKYRLTREQAIDIYGESRVINCERGMNALKKLDEVGAPASV